MLDLNKIYCMDCLEGMKNLDDNSIDSIVTDPPYFLVSKSGSGFMGKQWDSLNSDNAYNILCKSDEFARIAEKFFMSLRVESNGIGVSSAPENASTTVRNNQIGLKSNVPFVENGLNATKAKSKASSSSVHGIVLTKENVLDMLKELSPNHMSAIESQNGSVLFAIPYLYIIKLLRNIVPENVLKLPIEKICRDEEIQVILTDEVRVKSATEAMIGSMLGDKFMNGMDINAEYAENIVTGTRYRHIISSSTNKQKIIRWIILLLFAINVIGEWKGNQNLFLMYHFHRNWATEANRVLKDGAFMFSMCIPRQDCLSTTIKAFQDAGFDTSFTSIFWTFASGFPKSQNIGLTIDKQECRKQLIKKLGRKPTKEEFDEAWKTFREIVGKNLNDRTKKENILSDYGLQGGVGTANITIPATDQAKDLDGSYAGFQPKPAVEIIIVAMKPLSKKSYVDQALKNGKGITWLGNCKIPYVSEEDKEGARYGTQADIKGANLKGDKKPWGVYGKNVLASTDGRFPANLLVSDDMLNDGKNWKAGGSVTGNEPSQPTEDVYGKYGRVAWQSHGDSGSYSRYFDLDSWFKKQMEEFPSDIQNTFPFIAIPKAKRSERDLGLEKMEDGDRKTPMAGRGQEGLKCKKCGKWKHSGSPCKCSQPEFEKIKFNRPSVKNIHPTVKPLKLFSYLIVLGSREGDVILDPYIGSGTTGLACKLLNRKYIGFENNADYYKIAQARLSADIKKYRVHIDKKLIKDDEREGEPPEKDYSTRLDNWV